MLRKFLTVALLGVVVMNGTSCTSGNGFKKINGVEYKIVKDAPGKTAVKGDIVEFNILAKVDTMVLGDSRKQMNGEPARMMVDTISKPGSWQAVIPFLSAGDSAIVEISCDTLLKNIPPTQQQLPPWLKKGKKITIYLSIVSIKSSAEMQKEQTEKSSAQAGTDDKMLQDFFAKNNIKANKTASGLYYTIEKEGTGAPITSGQKVTMNYTGKTLDGKEFDSNLDEKFHHVKPFEFTSGAGGVIRGWDEGVMLLKKGSKATLYVPSTLAYGPQSPSPELAPNSNLIFTVEVTDVK